jgi:hypothetical protein
MARPGLTRNRKFLRLARCLGGQALAVGSLELLWGSSYESGDEIVGAPEDVEALASWNGAGGVLFAALRDAGLPDRPGFIEECPDRPGVWRIHDLWDHAPDYVRKRRSREMDRQTKGAKLESLSGQRPVDDRSETGHGPPFGRTPAPAPAPAPAPMIVNTIDSVGVCSEPPKKPATSEPDDPPPRKLLVLDYADEEPAKEAEPTPPEPSSPAVAVLPVVGEGSKEFPVTEAMELEWKASYPGVEVHREVLRAIQWARDNPTRQKTVRGAKKFLGGWLARAQERGGAAAPNIRRGMATPSEDWTSPEASKL